MGFELEADRFPRELTGRASLKPILRVSYGSSWEVFSDSSTTLQCQESKYINQCNRPGECVRTRNPYIPYFLPVDKNLLNHHEEEDPLLWPKSGYYKVLETVHSSWWDNVGSIKGMMMVINKLQLRSCAYCLPPPWVSRKCRERCREAGAAGLNHNYLIYGPGCRVSSNCQWRPEATSDEFNFKFIALTVWLRDF